MSAVFLSYRRADAPDATGRIYDQLKVCFDPEKLFTDVDSIPYGADFEKAIDDAVGACDVLLAIIGADWLAATDRDGGRRLDDPTDYVRLEICSALKRNIPVIPVLVKGATMPAAHQLPEPLAVLAKRNAAVVRADPDFHNDMKRLVEQISRYTQLESAHDHHKPARRSRRMVVMVAAAILLVLMAGFAARLLPWPSPVSDHSNVKLASLDSPKGKVFFLGVGINAYQDTATRPIPLQYTHRDNKRLQDALRENNPHLRLAGCEVLLDSEASRRMILANLLELKESVGPEDLGIVSFSGYEYYSAEKEEFYILPYDADSDAQNRNALSAQDLYDALQDCKGKVTVWLDTCNSGKMASQLARLNPQIATFASTQAGSYCYEFSDIEGGVFTSAMVEGLRGAADRNRDHVVTLSELALFVPNKAFEIVNQRGLVQDVVITGALDDTAVTVIELANK
jgi:hypothetical protein